MRNLTIKKVALAGVLLALGLVLPFLTVQIPVLGQRLLPMHLPVLLGGFVLGAPLAGFVGFILPLLRSILFGTPPFFPIAVAMSLELWAYGFLTGWFYRYLPRKDVFIYVNLILSMAGGRLVWGMVSFVLHGLAGTTFTWDLFVSSAIWVALPGIVIQIILIPAIVMALRGSKRSHRA